MSIHNPIPKWVTYKVNSNSNVKVRVLIGDAQQGGWAVGFGTDDIKKGTDPDAISVGTGKEVKGRTLQVVATVVDVRPETNRLSTTVIISGGPGGDLKVPQSYDDGANGDCAILTTLVDFE